MTSIGTLRELDAEVEAALSAEHPCEAPRGCTNVAAWLIVIPCGCTGYCCERCRIKQNAVEALMDGIPGPWMCGICNRPADGPMRYEALR